MSWIIEGLFVLSFLAFIRMLNCLTPRHLSAFFLLVGFLFFSLELWCMGFYALIGLSVFDARPWLLWLFIQNMADLTPKIIMAFWSLPLLITSFWLFIKLAPLFKSALDRLYGNAHFATMPEIRKMGFLKEEGLYVGRLNGRYLRYRLTNHVLLFAPSRSGKGVSVVIPNALMWQGSLLVTDNKYELFKETSGYRASQSNRVFRFSPAESNGATHRINPLDYIDMDDKATRVAALHSFLDILIVSGGEENQMWAEEARSLALGLLIWLSDTGKPFNLGELAYLVKGQSLVDFLQEIVDVYQESQFDYIAYAAMQNFLGKAPKEQSGVRSQLTSMLRLWEDPRICAATAVSDVDFRTFRTTPTTLYLSFGTDQISRLAPLINLLVQQFLNVMLHKIPDKNETVKVLCLLDEINRFGRMDKLKDGFGDLAGYGVHLVPVIQNLGQFHSTYKGRDNTDIFLQNTDLKIAFRQNAETDKQFVSKELGPRTMRVKSRSYHTDKSGASYSETRLERPLMSPDDIGKLDKNTQLLITGEGVIRCKKIIYYTDSFFKSKIINPIVIPTISPIYPIVSIPVNTNRNEALNLDEIEALARHLED